MAMASDTTSSETGPRRGLLDLVRGLDLGLDLPERIDPQAGERLDHPVVRAVEEDSRRCGPGTLFVARAGSTDAGIRHLDDAVDRGAVAVLVGESDVVPAAIAARTAVLRASDPATTGARLAHRLHDEPTQALDVIAVTGTNGKTTIAALLRTVLACAGRRCGVVGTIEIDDGATRSEATLTTPAAPDLAGIFARCRRNGCDAIAIEASSHALAQGRLTGTRVATAVFSNLTGDHLDYHGSMEAYADAKARLFDELDTEAWAVVNIDDPATARMVRDTSARVLACSLGAPSPEASAAIEACRDDGRHAAAQDAETRAVAMIERADRTGTDVAMHGPWGEIRGRVRLVGRHNIENALLAIAAAWSRGVERDALEAALARLEPPPGRLDPAADATDDIGVFVDYAHTDDALRNVLRAARPLVAANASLVVVFGCGGDRDRTKRPRMARAAADLADRLVVTSDNPRTEDPAAIVAEVVAGLRAAEVAEAIVEVDRAIAIRRAIEDARAGDVVVIAGKGHEDYQIIGKERRAFDDRVHARAALERRRARPDAEHDQDGTS